MDIEALYRYRFADINQADRAKVWHEISRFVFRIAGEPAKVLDPACGLGEFINSCPSPERWAMDLGLDGSMLADGITFTQMSFLASNQSLPRNHFDLVFASNVLEHLPDQQAVNAFLRRAREVLAPGGRVIVMGPNFKYCAKDYFDCADHVVPLTHVSIEEHLVAAGFELSRTIPRFLPYSFRSRLPSSSFATRAYLLFPPAWRFLGRQFLVVGTRPASS